MAESKLVGGGYQASFQGMKLDRISHPPHKTGGIKNNADKNNGCSLTISHRTTPPCPGAPVSPPRRRGASPPGRCRQAFASGPPGSTGWDFHQLPPATGFAPPPSPVHGSLQMKFLTYFDFFLEILFPEKYQKNNQKRAFWQVLVCFLNLH